MAEKKHYEPPPLGMLGMKLGQIAQKLGIGKKAQDIEKGGFKLKPLAPHKPSPSHPKSGHYPHPPPPKEPPGPVKIEVYPFHDPETKEESPGLVTLKVPKHKMSVEEFADRLKELGLGLAAGHQKIITGNKAHIAIVSRAEAKAASNENPGSLVVGKEPKPRVKWTSAGCVVLDSMEDKEHVYVIKPSHHYGPWAFPKGRVDKGESIKQAALREVWEETGLHVKILTGKGAYLGKLEGGFSFTHFFLAVKTGGHPRPTEETERVLLVTWDEARHLFRSGGNRRDQRVLELAKQALKQYE